MASGLGGITNRRVMPAPRDIEHAQVAAHGSVDGADFMLTSVWASDADQPGGAAGVFIPAFDLRAGMAAASEVVQRPRGDRGIAGHDPACAISDSLAAMALSRPCAACW